MQDSVEEWKPVMGFEDYYWVSDRGRVMRIAGGNSTRAGRILARKLNNYGYVTVGLHRLGIRVDRLVHTLVAEVFIGEAPTGFEINHVDGVKTNNAVSNLEYVTSSRNKYHAYQTGLRKLKLTPEKVVLAKRRYAELKSLRAVAAEFGVHHKTVGTAIRTAR